MGIHKTLPLFVATLLTGVVVAQSDSPVASVITNDSEATSVLGGGWPPQNFGKKVGSSTVKDILNGARDKVLKIKDQPAPGSTAKKADPKLLGQTTAAVAAPKAVAKTAKPEFIKTPSFKLPVLPKPTSEAKQKTSTLLGGSSPLSPLILPPLPAVVDVVSPGLKRLSRPERPQQKRVKSLYTLGPGDTVSFSTFDRGDLARTVRIAPDGTVSYLQAVAIDANGLTVDELRDRMEDELQKYRRDFKLVVSPQELRSKEFAILGRVQQPGTFPLDRPVTVLEGIALAKGVEIGTIRGSAFGLADFGKSFVSRKGRKLDVDFAKLYHEGDFSQNVYLQPNDYVYVASILKNEFYILGAVNSPGRVQVTEELTVAKAIALSGGFQNEAYRMKVLLIRGDINNPNVRVINVRDVLRGNGLDVKIEDNDIIFVARRPFEILERVLDSAITTYVQTVTAEAMNLNYNPFSG